MTNNRKGLHYTINQPCNKHKEGNSLVVALIDVRPSFEVKIDTSVYTMEDMLAQEGKVDSIQLKDISDLVEKCWTYETEMYAYVQVVKHWRHYLIRK